MPLFTTGTHLHCTKQSSIGSVSDQYRMHRLRFGFQVQAIDLGAAFGGSASAPSGGGGVDLGAAFGGAAPAPTPATAPAKAPAHFGSAKKGMLHLIMMHLIIICVVD